MAIDGYVKDLEKEAKQLERDLYDEIMSVVVGLLVVDGRVVFNERNMYLVDRIDRAVDSFNRKYQKAFLGDIRSKLSGLDAEYTKYFRGLGLNAKRLEGFSVMMGRMDNYLDSVSVIAPVKQQVKNYLFKAIAQGKSFGSIRLGLRDILGLKDRYGALNRYYRTFIYDAIMQFDRIVSNAHAKQNDLNYFQYKGGLIETSREFCIKRDGLVFRREHADDWKNDPDLPGYPDVASYDPLIDLGRWNCRHYLLWLTDEQAKEILDGQGEE